MMPRLPVALALAVLLAWPVSQAHAWNEVGHMIVAKVAYDHMDEATRKQLAQLLQKHPHYEEFLASNCPKDADLQEWAFLRASTWPDWIRPARSGAPRPTRITRYHRADDHYVNMPIVLPGDEALFTEKDLQPPADKNDILCAFRQRVGELKSKETTEDDKAVAICWMEHLIGDVHQPLHSCTLFSSQFKRGDRGGNEFALRIGGQGWVLHTYWDALLGAVPNYLEDTPEHQTKVYQLVKEMVESLHDPKYGRDKLSELGDHKTFPGWAEESFALARAVAYRDGGQPLRGAAVVAGHAPREAPEAGKDYDATAKALARKRAALAGYRLADTLSALLSAP
jgi:hypothetical protein